MPSGRLIRVLRNWNLLRLSFDVLTDLKRNSFLFGVWENFRTLPNLPQWIVGFPRKLCHLDFP